MKKVLFVLAFLTGFLVSYGINNWESSEGFVICTVIGFTGAMCSFFLDFAFREGNIFAFWARFITKYFYENDKNPFGFLYSPLGGCAFCMNIWISTFIYVAMMLYADLSWLYLLPCMVISHFALSTMYKHFDLE